MPIYVMRTTALKYFGPYVSGNMYGMRNKHRCVCVCVICTVTIQVRNVVSEETEKERRDWKKKNVRIRLSSTRWTGLGEKYM